MLHKSGVQTGFVLVGSLTLLLIGFLFGREIGDVSPLQRMDYVHVQREAEHHEPVVSRGNSTRILLADGHEVSCSWSDYCRYVALAMLSKLNITVDDDTVVFRRDSTLRTSAIDQLADVIGATIETQTPDARRESIVVR